VNAAKSGVGRTWERKFLGFRLNRERQIEAAPESVERFKAKVREKWRSCQSLTSNQLRDNWRGYLRGWWGYYQLAENRRPIFRLEGWIRRHIRKCFWLRWHEPEGRERRLRSLGLRERMLKVAQSFRGAWHLAGTGSLQAALSNAKLRRHGFLMPSDLASSGAQPPSPDPLKTAKARQRRHPESMSYVKFPGAPRRGDEEGDVASQAELSARWGWAEGGPMPRALY
jgi:RNA-directed DNA polymerase